ncbi:MAG: endonuclease III [Nitrospinota bacterium]|nr:MAG: endonuclease III [Nitrospinota bacterium]
MSEHQETLAPQKERTQEIIRRLKELYPDARCSLHFTNPLELLVATILSAQCTDERVNRVTATLFQKYRTAQDYLSVPLEELEEDIRPTGFYKNKARTLRRCCQALVEHHGGQVPADMASLVKLSGIGRKTANVVLGNAFHRAEGIVVDTHVKRLAGRLGLSGQTDPEKIEADLMRLVPQEEWVRFAHLLIYHGRQICGARKPKCAECVLADLCPSAQEEEKRFS